MEHDPAFPFGQAEILIIGDELLAGDIEDRNGPYLAARLGERGVPVRQMLLLPDETERIAASLNQALERAGVVLLAGGLGPTSDDRTTEAVARALGRPLVHHEESWTRLVARFRVRNTEPPPGNEKQALLPAGADVLANDHGTAPGYALEEKGCLVAVLPGPPKENRPMFENKLAPWLEHHLPGARPRPRRLLRTFGLGESAVGQRLAGLEQAHPRVRFGYRFSFPEILVKLQAAPADETLLEEVTAQAAQALAPHVYSTGEQQLPEVLGQRLLARGLRIATAESCTGGLTAQLLTDTPGSSAWVERAFVTYTNEAKEQMLGVPHELLEAHGAVSEPTALAMLQGALAHSAADVAVAITGIAGPGGGSEDKPVGTVCIAWGNRQEAEVHTFRFGPWSRDFVRRISAWTALHRLMLQIER